MSCGVQPDCPWIHPVPALVGPGASTAIACLELLGTLIPMPSCHWLGLAVFLPFLHLFGCVISLLQGTEDGILGVNMESDSGHLVLGLYQGWATVDSK